MKIVRTARQILYLEELAFVADNTDAGKIYCDYRNDDELWLFNKDNLSETEMELYKKGKTDRYSVRKYVGRKIVAYTFYRAGYYMIRMKTCICHPAENNGTREVWGDWCTHKYEEKKYFIAHLRRLEKMYSDMEPEFVRENAIMCQDGEIINIVEVRR